MSDRANKESLLILGASARAAAESALRAGLQPICADLFADEDLRAMAAVQKIIDYPHGLFTAAAAAPPCPWIYTGALENHPELIARISAEHALWGNSAEVVKQIRDPVHLRDVLREAELPSIDLFTEQDRPPLDGAWLLKPLRSAAGRGIRIWNDDSDACATLHEPHYFQRRLAGGSFSALFVATAHTAHLIGLTRQLVGERALNAGPFAYCGSIGPVRLAEKVTLQIERIGTLLAKRSRIRGLFGLDLICDETAAFVTEINPRYTASVEIYELAQQIPLLDWHRRACVAFADRDQSTAVDDLIRRQRLWPREEENQRVIGKAILYAWETITIPSWEGAIPRLATGQFPRWADRPCSGSLIAAGQPMCTVLVDGADESECREAISCSVNDLQDLFSK